MSAPRVDPLAGKPAPALAAREYSAPRHGVLHRAARSRASPGSAWPSAPRAIAARRSRRASTRRISSPSTQAICLYRKAQGIDGPLFLGIDTHALTRSPPSRSALEVLAANGVDVDDRPRRRLRRRRRSSRTRSSTTTAAARRVSPTASSSRPRTIRPRTAASSTTRRSGGPADTEVTRWIEDRAERSSSPRGLAGVEAHPVRARAPRADARTASTYVDDYVDGPRRRVLDIGGAPRQLAQARRRSARRRRRRVLGADRRAVSACGSTVVNETVDPTFRFMTVDWDGKIRMDLLLALCHGRPHRRSATASIVAFAMRPRRTTATAS